jgi:ABC-type dipeptide/oligopeptide/nickel transport system permease component
MTTYLLRRLLAAVPVLLGVSILVFSMLHLTPGDPVVLMLSGGGGSGASQGASAEAIERLRRELGLDQPVWMQYLRWIGNALRGDLGRSIWSNQRVTEMIVAQLGSTFQLTIAGLGLAVVLGVLLGVIAAMRAHSWLDSAIMAVASLGVSMPAFWLGLILIFIFSLRLGWFPATGAGGLNRLILPAAVLGLEASAIIARLVRSSMLEVMRQEYVTTARAKGLSERVVVLRHALRNALVPVVTVVGLQFGAVLSGTVVLETVFARQGIGRLAITAINGKDFPLVQGIVLFVAIVYVFVNLAVDLLYGFIDPRIRYR